MRPTVELKPIKRRIPIFEKERVAELSDPTAGLAKAWPHPVAAWQLLSLPEGDMFTTWAPGAQVLQPRELTEDLSSRPATGPSSYRGSPHRDTVSLQPITRKPAI